MNWKEKLRIVREAARAVPEMAIVFADAAGADRGFVDGLRREFAYLDHDYLEFLQLSDGIQLDAFQLFGSGKSKFRSISAAKRLLASNFHDEALPIGSHPCSDYFMLCKDGCIKSVNCRMDHVSEGPVMAGSFSQLLSDVLMGSLYPRLFDGLPPGYDNQWMAFLRQQGWM